MQLYDQPPTGAKDFYPVCGLQCRKEAILMCRRLRDLRNNRGISQRALAEVLHISQGTYSRYERGQRALSVQAAYRLALFYGVSMDYLAGLTDDPRPRWRVPPRR